MRRGKGDAVDNEAELIVRAQAGDSEAYSALYAHYTPILEGWLRNQHASDPEDVVSQVWVSVVQTLPTYEDRGHPFSAWLFRIARSRMIDGVRKHVREAPTTPLEAWHGQSDDAPCDDHADLLAALPALSARQQQLIRLYILEDRTMADVAEQMGITIGAGKALYSRAAKALRARINGEPKRPRKKQEVERAVSRQAQTPSEPEIVLRGTIRVLKFDPRQCGTRRWLPPLEDAIMRIFWSRGGRATVKQVHAALVRGRPIAYNTVMTTMTRLFEKELLHRKRSGLAFVYTAPWTLDEFVSIQLRYVHEALAAE